jgi:AbiJ N-terminal domain 4
MPKNSPGATFEKISPGGTLSFEGQQPKPAPLADRKNLTFEQAEGVEPLPQQLRLKELSDALRAALWYIVHDNLERHIVRVDFDGTTFGKPWDDIFMMMHVRRHHGMIDDFIQGPRYLIAKTRAVFEKGDYVAVFGWIQWVLRYRPAPEGLAEDINFVLTQERAAYRIVDGDTIVPIGSEAELATIERAFADLAAAEFHGARGHLRKASEQLTAGHYADSVRESIHAVESVAKVLEPSAKVLSTALAKLEKSTYIHPTMKIAFDKLYAYTNDEQGVRHATIDASKVDETDALFMIGACAAFVSYMINKSRKP